MNVPEPRDAEAGMPPGDDHHPRRQRSSIPSLLLVSLVLYMLTTDRGEEMVVRNKYIEALESLNYQMSNYSSWLNGTASDFSFTEEDKSAMPLVDSFLTFGSQVDTLEASYYSNLTGFWRGDLQYHNLSSIPGPLDGEFIREWHGLAEEFMTGANMTNATEVAERLGDWNWTASAKVALSVGDKLIWNEQDMKNMSKDIAMIHGKIDLTDPGSSEEFRLDFDGVHFISNGSIYAFAEPSGRHIDIRYVPALVPGHRMNETARIVELELSSRIAKIKQKIDAGTLDEDSGDDDKPKSSCSFEFYAQIDPSSVPQRLLQELEDEIDKPTGISTIRPPPLNLTGVLVSKNCGILYEIKDTNGMKSQRLYRKITTYAGLSTLVNFALLVLLSRQMTRSRSAAGLSRVSRYPFLAQSLIDAISFVGHVTLGILADGRPSISVLAPAGLACILFVYEAQFAVLIGQIQAPEDVEQEVVVRLTPAPLPSPAPPLPQPSSPTTPTLLGTNGNNSTDTAASNARAQPQYPPTTTVPTPAPTTQQPPQQPGLLRFLFHHIRTDPTARLWTLMSFFLIVVFRIVVILSLPVLFVGSLYAFMWVAQIYRAAKRGRTSGLRAEYVIGSTLCRLYFVLYFLACPKNILDVEPRGWVYFVACFILLQVTVILLQEYLGPTFFLPKGMATPKTYDYHPPMPLPDPEAPEQTLGDCAICMDAILVDPSLRHHPEEKSSDGGVHGLGLGSLSRGGLWAQAGARKSYSLAPCHHLFHTACLERWLAIKNICPQCRRPLPPL